MLRFEIWFMSSSSSSVGAARRPGVIRTPLPDAGAKAESPRDDAAPEAVPENDDQSLCSFVLEVSASRPQGVGVASGAGSGRLRRLTELPGKLRRRATPRPTTPGEPSKRDPVGPASIIQSPLAAPVDVTQPRARVVLLNQRGKRRAPPIWMSSLAIHAVFILLLAAFSITTVDPPKELLLWASPPTLEEEVTITDVNLDADADISQIADLEELSAELIDPGQASVGLFAAKAALAEAAGETSLPMGSLGDVGALFGESGAGLTEFGSGLGDAPTAQFFGAKIEGRRIVFVLDNSGSMQSGRLETVIAEVMRCIESLSAEQEFYVIFHSDTVYPMFYPDPVDRFIQPTDRNKQFLTEWLATVELCLGDSVDEALVVAAMIRPDTVFLLSDGRIHGDRTMRFLMSAEQRDFPIHTFAVGLGASVVGRRNLGDIAAANGGEFREGDVPEEMRLLSRSRPRPYHADRPGLVWGRNVKSSGFR